MPPVYPTGGSGVKADQLQLGERPTISIVLLPVPWSARLGWQRELLDKGPIHQNGLSQNARAGTAPPDVEARVRAGDEDVSPHVGVARVTGVREKTGRFKVEVTDPLDDVIAGDRESQLRPSLFWR